MPHLIERNQHSSRPSARISGVRSTHGSPPRRQIRFATAKFPATIWVKSNIYVGLFLLLSLVGIWGYRPGYQKEMSDYGRAAKRNRA